MIVISREVRRRKNMCHPIPGGSASMGNAHCSCDCGCPVLLSVGDEIRMLEDYRKMMQERIVTIDAKISALKTLKPS
jgi:hypothetical protein